ncbi:MAG: 5'-nucleotidase, lipoprotein e(P4) family [Methyloligellaceae bacterium]
MKPKSIGVIALVLAGLFASGAFSRADRPLPHETMNAALWMQTAAEYRMVATQAFQLAALRLESALRETSWTAAPEQTGGYRDLPAAAIFDLDETVIDNAPFQAQLVLDDATFDGKSWGRWVRKEKASEIPGAAAFLRLLQDRGVRIFYVTNRDTAGDAATAANLRALGYPLDDDAGNLLSKHKQDGWGSDKTTRRAHVAKTHRILFLFGDDLNDFVTGARGPGVTVAARNGRAEAFREYWGTRWFVLPNPAYGSWERILYDFQYDLSRSEKLRLKRGQLVGYRPASR